MEDKMSDKTIKEIRATFVHDICSPLLYMNICARNLKQYLPMVLEGYQQAIKQGHAVQEIPPRAQQLFTEMPNMMEEYLDKMQAIINTFLAQLTDHSQSVALKKPTPSLSKEGWPNLHQPQQPDRMIRVLLAENERIHQQVAVDMLELLGCHVDIADNGQAAIDRWQATSYDLIFMDCRLPELDGYQAASIIRQMEAGAGKIPIIALTASIAEDERGTCLQAGMNDLITKPLKLEKLRIALEKFIPLL